MVHFSIPKSKIVPNHLPNAAHAVNIRPVDDRAIPRNFRSLLCITTVGGEHERGNIRRGRYGIPACGNCDRILPWFLHQCVSCGDFFIRDFLSAKFCSLYPHCFDCLPRLSWAYCPDHASYFATTFHGDVDAEYPPTGINPRKYTEEELANAFDFGDL